MQISNCDRVISTIEKMLKYPESQNNRTINEQIDILDFCINLLCIDFSVSSSDKILTTAKDMIPDPPKIPYIKPYTKKKVELSKTHCVAYPWDLRRYTDSILDVTYNGFDSNRDDITADYYEELNLLIVTNGRHHAAIGDVLDSGSIQADCYRLSDYFGKLKCNNDKNQWEYKSEHEPYNYDLAILYQLAEIRYHKQKQPQQINTL